MTTNVAIVIPCYNHNVEVRKALASLTRLTPGPAQVIVVDDGSDRPVDVHDFVAELPLTLVRTENQGLAAARNTGLEYVSTDWVLFLDADDSLYPHALDVSECFKLAANTGLIMRGYERREGDCSRLIYPAVGDPAQALLQCNLGPPHSFLFSTSAVKSINGFDPCPELRRGHEDYDLITRLINAGYKLTTHHDVVCTYYKYPGSMSSHKDNMLFSQLWAWQRFFLNLTSPTPQRVEQALDFYARHYTDFLAHQCCDIEKVTNKLLEWVADFPPDELTVRFILSVLPEQVQQRFLVLCEGRGNSAAAYQEVFDWRAQHHVLAMAYRRLSQCVAYGRVREYGELVIWGANDIAQAMLPLVTGQFDVRVIDTYKVGGRLAGIKVGSPQYLNEHPESLVFVAAHQHYTTIKRTLRGAGIDEERIF